MPGLAGVHPVALARTWLLGDPAVASVLVALGADADHIEEHITDRNEPPYPHVRLTDPPGDDRFGEHLIAPLVQVEVHGDLAGNQSRGVLREVLYVVLESLHRMPSAEVPAGQPVVTAVQVAGGGGWVPEPNGQPRYLATRRLFVHP